MPGEPIRIVITVEEGLVGSVFSTVPARITLVDFDLIDQGEDIETWDFDAADVEGDIAETLAAAQAAIQQAREAAEEAAQAARQSKYITSGGLACPFCGSDQITAAGIEAVAGQASQEVQCARCGKRWQNVFHLVEMKDLGP
jgi:hypothetical protein